MPSKKIEYNCTHCDASFIRAKYDIERTLKKNNTVFCSISCSKEYSNKIQLENILQQIKVIFAGNRTLTKLEQFANTKPLIPLVPIVVTESGILMLVKAEQPLNAWLPIVVTESGIVMLVKAEHSMNAAPTICVTLYVIPETIKLAKMFTSPEASDEKSTDAIPEPTV